MFLKRLTDFLLTSRINAFGVAFVCASADLISSDSGIVNILIILMSGLSAVIVGFITLQKGREAGAWILLASLAGALNYPLHPLFYGHGFGLLSLLTMISSNVLTWAGAIALRKTDDWGQALQVIGAVIIVTICVAHLWQPNLGHWWLGQLHDSMVQALSASGAPINTDETIAMIVRYFTISTALFVWLNALVQILLARSWQVSLNHHTQQLRLALRQVRLSRTSGIIFALAVLLSIWPNAVLVDILPIFYVSFGLAGLSVVHYFAAQQRLGWLVIAFAYFVIMPFGIMLMPLLGLLDVSINLRSYVRQIM